jgi:hypothetical protein
MSHVVKLMSRTLYAKLYHEIESSSRTEVAGYLDMSMMSKSSKKTMRTGRPATGLRGEKVSDYPQVMIRLPQPTKAALDALSGATGMPIWRLVDLAVLSYLKGLPEAQRRLVAGVRELRAESDES